MDMINKKNPAKKGIVNVLEAMIHSMQVFMYLYISVGLNFIYALRMVKWT